MFTPDPIGSKSNLESELDIENGRKCRKPQRLYNKHLTRKISSLHRLASFISPFHAQVSGRIIERERKRKYYIIIEYKLRVLLHRHFGIYRAARIMHLEFQFES